MSNSHRPYPPPPAPAAKPAGSGPDMMSIGMGLTVVLLALPAALGALWARRFVKSRQGTVAMLALVGGLLFAAVCLKPLKAHMTESRDTIKAAKSTAGIGGFFSAATGALPSIWLYTLPLMPILALVWDSVRPKSIDEQHEADQEKKQEKAQIAMDSAARRISRAVVRGRDEPKDLAPGINTAAVLAATISGPTVFFTKAHKKLLYLNTNTGASSLHMLFAGENGSGKTISMLRVAAAIAAVTEWDIIFINPKDDRTTMLQFRDLMIAYGRPCRLFPQEPYNGWKGDSGALLSRIMAIPGYAEDGAASYYADQAEVYLRAVLQSGEPMPASFEELEHRLDYDRLSKHYKKRRDKVGYARVASISREDAKSVFMRFATMTPKLTQIRGDGWSLDEARAGYLGLPIMANERDSKAVAKFVLEDIKHYLSVRKPIDRRVVFIIDEFSALGTESVIRLAEMARSLGGIVMLGTQTLAGLGDQDQQERIVGNMSVILHRMSAPEEVTRLAGVRAVMQKTLHFQGRERIKRGTYRIEEEDVIKAQDVRTLPTGCAWIIARGLAAKVQMGMPPAVPEAPMIIRRRPVAPLVQSTVTEQSEVRDTDDHGLTVVLSKAPPTTQTDTQPASDQPAHPTNDAPTSPATPTDALHAQPTNDPQDQPIDQLMDEEETPTQEDTDDDGPDDWHTDDDGPNDWPAGDGTEGGLPPL